MAKPPIKPPTLEPLPNELPELTLSEWFNTPELPSLLGKTLKEPHMRIFMEILKEHCRYSTVVTQGPTLIAGIDIPKGSAALNNFREGGNSIITLIKGMSKMKSSPQTQGTPDPRNWGEVRSFQEPPKKP